MQTLDRVGSKHGTSISNVAARWVLERPGVAAVILGARNANHVQVGRRAGRGARMCARGVPYLGLQGVVWEGQRPPWSASRPRHMSCPSLARTPHEDASVY